MDRSDQFEYADQFMHRSALGLTQIQTGYWVESAPTAVGRAISYPSSTLEKIAEIESASFWFRHRNKMIASMVMQFPPIGPILDVGGGNGYVALELQRRGLQSIVLEADTAGALTSYYRGLPVIAALFKRELFVPASVPSIGLFDVLEHVEDDKGFLSDCGAILNQGGMLYLTVPALSFLWSSDDIYAGHFRRYDRRSLSAVLQQAGFKIKRIGYFFSCLAPAIFLCRTLPS